jgi:glutamate--cysteine ligase
MSTQQSGSAAILVKDGLIDQTVKLLLGSAATSAAPAPKKMGIEIEMPFVTKKKLKPLPFSGKKSITAVFNQLARKTAWKPGEIENGKVTALKNETGVISLEPGGQIEFASAPRMSLAQLAADIKAYCADIGAAGKHLGIDALPFGFHPHVGIEACPFISERTRFAALKPVFEAEGGFAAWGQSSSVQVTLDGKAMDDAFGAFKLGLALQPLAAAMASNSPFALGKDSGYKSWRRKSLLTLDSPYYKAPDKLFDKDYTMKDWAAHVLSVPMSFVVRGDHYIAVAPKPFIDMVGKPLPELAHMPKEQQYLTQKDLLDHTTGIKPEMLLKPNLLLEFRAADLGPTPAHWMGLAAFWVGLFYDKDAFKQAQDYVANWSNDDRKSFHDAVAKDGLQAKLGNKTAQQMALDLLEISKQGLLRLEPSAAPMLDILKAQVTQGQTPADQALKKLAANGGNMKKTLKQSLLFGAKSSKHPPAA